MTLGTTEMKHYVHVCQNVDEKKDGMELYEKMIIVHHHHLSQLYKEWVFRLTKPKYL